ncbi:BamA/OMP85 family outer membrane protein [Sporomusa acidovorans]|uniref:Outer membrane protein assembly factor BamA n=1 Tax=Sporomusa acidovorans (strain ATCC 49682 / DSM 3132 / Mol) TaxID=1123286 RepID=A0ABZ3J742_SPOA4|nr:BamA/TamA family outer membrane protein [Sporomusa acidovorans]OZC19283.1 outer membrane protein assembly factor BamA precursor [Sporomusa acidovorans DSM 3132]SDD81957.1 Beta-barrel assembly machine subunit BamA [Sporomusa acidovorans]
MKTDLRCKILVIAALVVSMAVTLILPAYAAEIEGKTATAITVTGMNKVAESTIRGVIKIQPGDTLTADKVKQDMQAIYDLGYFFDVVANFTEVPEGVKVVYTVMENPALTDIVVKGNTKVSADKIKELVTTSKDGILNTRTLNTNVRAIEQYYHDQGYILAKVSDVAMSPGGVLTLTINEGVLEGIVIKGNEKTKENVITREMKVKPGEPFNAKDARRSMQKVYNLGYFEDVNMKLNPGKEPNAVVLEADVVEQKTGTFSIGGGYSKADGMVGIIEVGDNNFRGSGDKVKFHWEFGGASDRNYEVSFTRPWLDSKQTSLSFSVYDLTNEYTDYKDGTDDEKATYDKNRKGVDITLGRPSGEYIQNYITFKNRRDTYDEWKSGEDYSKDPQYLKDNFGLTRSITLMRVFDSRDNVFAPTEGARYSLSAEFAGKALGGDFSFNKYTAEGRKYFKIDDNHVIATRMTVGYASGHISDSNRFEVGGSDTLRGYEDDQYKGDKMIAGSVEYRFPVVSKIQGVLFTDFGNAWKDEGYKLNDLKTSVGVGIRMSTPIGPIRIDFAKGSEGGRTHFSFGGQF